MASTPVPAFVSEGNLSRYLQDIRKFPMLEHVTEYMLAQSWREHGDRDAAAQLVSSHLRLVAKIAMGYRGYGLPVGELIAARMSVKELGEFLGLDSFHYLSLPGLLSSTGVPNPEQTFCKACFDGCYPVDFDQKLSKHCLESNQK